MSSAEPTKREYKKVFDEAVQKSIVRELKTIWAAHHAVGLKGKMCLYTLNVQEPWRSKEAGLALWFGPDEIESLLPHIEKHYNEGMLPNSPLLLNPIVHDENKKPIGSGVVWATGFALGVEKMEKSQFDRINDLGAYAGSMTRGDTAGAGLKIVGFLPKALPPLEDGYTVDGSRELFEIANFSSDMYYRFYLLSGLSYLGKHGGFMHTDFSEIIPADQDIEKAVAAKKVDVQHLKDAFFCWKSYDRHHSLYTKFGVRPEKVENNLKYYNLCARDVGLFDATGIKHNETEVGASFDFLVKGWLPRGSVTLLAAAGGAGKSSLVHNLAVKASIDFRPDEPPPTWLGAEINVPKSQGISVYLGEDSPAIVASRAKVFDPEERALRLMVQRTDFGEGVSFSTFLKRLMKLPDVPLMVIDPARKYIVGDENDATSVRAFFDVIEEFAVIKNTAVLVVHYLVKGAVVKNVLDIYDLLRGSQVFIDRSRVVIGMYRDGPHAVAGLAKNNIPPQMGMVSGERVFVRDSKHIELVPVPGPEGIRGENLTDDQIEAIKHHD
jgi:hypothetical protein